MDSSEPSPRRELQGPRPAPLKVRKDSYKIKKPPLAPAPAPAPAPAQPPPQHRPDPVIIYTVSPKIIHATPSDFMMLVQRLTGAASTSAADPSLPSPSFAGTSGGALSPAARLATFEKTAPDGDRQRILDDMDHLGGHGGAAVDRSAQFPGILSPVPSSLPPISPNFFSPSLFDPSFLAFLHELSPAVPAGNKSFVDSTFLTSPNNFLSTPTLPSPGAYWDLFNQFQDS